ncbi:hypothetical protein [Candidatus Spyradosoma sp. SGI.093]|uniref:hypothetical protein n=1 Tax=Candidatus Spyradosoma sp. SGI.093 TaxID=3420583 RepID=UPI003D062E5D
MKRLALWILVAAAAAFAFFASFRDAVDMASIARTDAGGVLRARVVNDEAELRTPGAPLRLKIEYAHAEKKSADGVPAPMPFPQPFVAVLVDGNNRVVARLQPPDADGNVPAISDFPRGEKYLWVGFPLVLTDGRPTSLLLRNPFAER